MLTFASYLNGEEGLHLLFRKINQIKMKININLLETLLFISIMEV